MHISKSSQCSNLAQSYFPRLKPQIYACVATCFNKFTYTQLVTHYQTALIFESKAF